MSGRPVRKDIAMTGEITLRGRVLPIGGVKEKVLGAHRAGITTIVLPKANEADLEDIPEEVRDQLTFHPVETLDEVFTIALLPAHQPQVATHKTENGRSRGRGSSTGPVLIAPARASTRRPPSKRQPAEDRGLSFLMPLSYSTFDFRLSTFGLWVFRFFDFLTYRARFNTAPQVRWRTTSGDRNAVPGVRYRG